MKKNTYGNDSITSLKGADRVRLRPSVIFGSDGLSGCQHSIFEILSNSIDEARAGYGDRIEIKRYSDFSVHVKDNGRGTPLDYNMAEQRYNWELIYCELYAGGKFNSEDELYKFSLGLNGLGACATQYSSEYMDVEVLRDGYRYNLHFEKGENIGGLSKTKTDAAATGTYIKWRPDRDVFTEIDVPLSYYMDVLKKQAIVNQGITFILEDEPSGETFTFYYENGLKDYIEELSQNKNITDIQSLSLETKGRDREDKDDYKLKVETVFCFHNEVRQLEYYHNSSFLEYGGAPDKAVRSAFLSSIDAYLKNNGLYKKDEKKITFTDIEDCLLLIMSSFSTETSYENQTKKAINNKFIQEAITDFLKQQLEIYFIENKAEAEKIAAQVLTNKRSREQAESTRLNIKKKLTGNIDISNRVEKFVNCRTKDVTKRELYIVEGDSALSSCKLGRDASFQAIMPIRGKILNCLKADYNRIFQSDIITDLIRVLGCGIEIKHKNTDLNSFDINNLRWSKVIICTDADVDGFQIRGLVLTMLYRLTPTLIEQNKVFIAESPLYEINTPKKTYFAYTDAERDKIVQKIKGKYKIQRSKGLGQNNPEMMWETTMNPESRKLIAVKPEEGPAMKEMFELLLGDNLQGRKEYIQEYGYKYIDLTATS